MTLARTAIAAAIVAALTAPVLAVPAAARDRSGWGGHAPRYQYRGGGHHGHYRPYGYRHRDRGIGVGGGVVLGALVLGGIAAAASASARAERERDRDRIGNLDRRVDRDFDRDLDRSYDRRAPIGSDRRFGTVQADSCADAAQGFAPGARVTRIIEVRQVGAGSRVDGEVALDGGRLERFQCGVDDGGRVTAFRYLGPTSGERDEIEGDLRDRDPEDDYASR